MRKLKCQKPRRNGVGIFQLTLAILLVFFLARCGQAPQTPAPASGTFSSVYSIFQNNNCTECHTPTGAATVDNNVKIDFSTQAKAYSSLMGDHVVTGIASKGSCGTVKLVDPNSPMTSYLTGVLFSDYYKSNNFAGVSGCNPYYNAHVSNFNLKASDETSMITWINAGAPNN